MARLGVQMFTLRAHTQDPDSLDRAFARIRAIGYRAVQVSGFGDITPDDTARLAREHGLEIGGTHVPWPRFLNDLDAVIEEHRAWNCRHTAVGMIPPDDYLSLEGLDRFLEELAPVTARLTQAGMTFSYHHHHHEFTCFDGRTWFAQLLERSDPEALGIELDTHWLAAAGADPVPWIHACGGRMPLLHLKDFRLGERLRRNFAAVGDGNMNWDDILDAAARYPIEYYFIEQDDCYGEDEFECLARSYRFLSARGLQ